ncbi:MAG: presenilin family intramembrane aspartyl protease [Nanoarchaeota archaeon]
MKHTWKITFLLLIMFFITQLIGLAILNAYAPEIKQAKDDKGNIINITDHNLPYGLEPPQDNDPKINLISILISLVIAITILFFFMKFGAIVIIRYWFFFVIILALGITINAPMLSLKYSSLISLFIALPLAYFKVFKRSIIVHNFTELLIYPGLAAIFVPLLNIWTIIVLLVVISLYDMYAVWHTGFMQKMAKFQIQQVRVFSGFFIPYIGKKDRNLIEKFKQAKSKLKNNLKAKKIKMSVAILGGGDVIFPIVLAGVVLRTLGLIPALIITVGATLALALLFYFSEKGKFYPAMPFISAGCFIALAVAYLI